MSKFSGPPGDVGSIETLKNMPRQEEALQLLKKLHSLCKPIQKKQFVDPTCTPIYNRLRDGWYLPTLTEFFPENPGLLGMNRNSGEKIYIRLRPYHAKDTFMDLEQDLVGTLLHEFSHNVRGPHDEIFYKTLDGLNKEYDEIRAKGYSGEGFLSDGSRLGVSHNLPPHEARAKAIAEAERRQKLSQVMGPAGGRTLGGTTAKGKSAFKHPRELMLEAAERRARDAKSCGHGEAISNEAIEKELRQANEDAVAHTIENHDLPPEFDELPPPLAATKRAKSSDQAIDSDDSDIEIIEKPSSISASSKASTSRRPDRSSKSVPGPPYGKRIRPDPPKPSMPTTSSNGDQKTTYAWTCYICTYENTKALALACEMCGSEKPTAGWQQVDDVREIAAHGAYGRITQNERGSFGWLCHVCNTETEDTYWTCRDCGIMKLNS